MFNKKVFISYGNLITDYIYAEDNNGNYKLLKRDGGGCEWNDLYNLSRMGEDCYAIASRGNDEAGKIAETSLINAGVMTNYVSIDRNQQTNIMNIIIPQGDSLGDNSVMHNWYSPITNELTMNFDNNLSAELPNSLKGKEIYVILDKFYAKHLEFIKNIQGNRTICLDVGHPRFIEHFTRKYLLDFFSQADFMQLNNNVSSLLLDRLKVNNIEELFKLLGLDLLVLTKGKKGATYVFKENDDIRTVNLEPEIVSKAVDTSGAGDAFFSRTLKDYAYLDGPITEDFVTKSFKSANATARKALGHIGSRDSNKMPYVQSAKNDHTERREKSH